MKKRTFTLQNTNSQNKKPRIPILSHLLFLGLFLFSNLNLNAQTPFNCEAIFYQVISGQLNSFDPATSSYIPIGPVNAAYNAIGYNSEDNFIYGVRNSSNNLVRIDANGILTNLGTVSNLASGGFTGDFDISGNLHIVKNDKLYVVDVSASTLTAQVIDITGATFNVADMAYNVVDNHFYGVSRNGTDLYKLNPTTGAITTLTLTGPIVIPGSAFGAVWGNSMGDFFASNNITGTIYEIDVNTAVSEMVAQGTPTGNNDGASCPLSATTLTENTPAACSDGIDNDGDGLIDCLDPDCGCPPTDCQNSNLGVLIAPQPSYTTCAVSSNGVLDAIAFNGEPGYTYLWSDGQTTVSATGLDVGTYTVTVTDTKGCTAEASGTVELHPEGIWLMTSTTNACGNSGTAQVSAMLGTSPYSYLWSNGQTTKDATGLAVGTHSVTVTDALGCQAIAFVEIFPGATISLFTTASYETCAGSSDATATVIASGGVAPYSYLWSDGQTTDIAVGLSAGTYGITVTDANGCSAETTQVVELSPEGIWIMVSGTDADCGVNNGTAHVGVMTGVPPYTFLWNDPAMQTTADPVGLAPGTYSVVVTDSNGCTAMGSVTINSNGTQLNVSISSTNEDCNNLGSATANVANGSGSYSYAWSNGGSTQTITDLVAGSYTVDVTDNNTGCFGTAMVTIIKECISTCNANAGTLSPNSINPCLNAGSSANLGATHTVGNVPAGFQTVYVLTTGTGLVIQATNSTPDFSVTGAGLYTIHTLVYDPATLDLSIVVPGVTTGFDVNGLLIQGGGNICAALDVAGAPFNLFDNPTASINGPYSTCPGGMIQLTANTSGSGLTYNWTASAGTIDDPTSAAPIYTMMMPGTYTITLDITDSNGCTASATSTVTINDSPNVDILPANASVCVGQSIDLSTNPSGPGYTYQWSASAGSFNDPTSATPTYTMMMPGTYTITVEVSDGGGCTGTGTTQVTISPSPTVEITPSNPSTCAGNSIDLSTTTSGTGLTYSWTASAGTFDDPTSATPSYTMMMPGTYTVTVSVSDGNGCDATASTQVTITSAPDVSITPSGNLSVCAGESITVGASASGGAGPYSYSWSATAGSFDDPASATPTYTMMMPGTYTLTVDVTDANGCTATASTQVTVNTSPTVSISPLDPTVCGAASIDFTATASSTNGPITYAWTASGGSFTDPTSATPTYNMMMPGTYTVSVTVSDGTGCDATASTQVTIYSSPDVSITPSGNQSVCPGDALGLNASTLSGTAPYSYSWTATGGTFDDASSASPNYSMMMPGTYTLTVEVTDANGCTDSTTLDVTVNPAPTVSISPQDQSTCGAASVDFTATATGNGPLSYLWSATGGAFSDATSATPTYTMMMPGTYTISVEVTDADGCTGSASTTVTVNPEISSCSASVTSSYFEGADISTRGGSDGSASASVVGGTAPFTYLWSDGQTTQEATGLSAGTYEVTISDAGGCSCVASVTLMDPAKLGNYVWEDIDQDGIQDPNEPAIEGVKVTLTGTTTAAGIAVMRMLFTDANGMYMFDGLLPGTYKVTFATPAGYTPTIQDFGTDDTVDSDPDPIMGMTPTVTLGAGDYDPTLDAGFYLCTNIGDYVWYDENHNGIQDPSEMGVEGVQVKLLMAGPDGVFCTPDDVLKAETTTGPNGEYQFACVTPGDYIISFMNLPTDWTFSSANQGGDDTLDSDADPATGKTDPFTVTYGQPDDWTFDAGIRPLCDQFFGGGGEISIGQQPCICPGETPNPIINIIAPSGGSGPIEYMWMFSTVDVPFDTTFWKPIPGAPDALEYQPGPLTQTTYFIRCARRLDCPEFVESNTVTVCVKDPIDCPAPFTTDDIEVSASVVNGEDVELTWGMGPELDQYNFFIERSFDGQSWTEIGNQAGKGNQTSLNKYDYMDLAPRKGVNYYRIRLVGLISGINYSKVLTIVISDEIMASLYPNPFLDVVNLAPIQDWESDGTIEIFNTDGRLMGQYDLTKGRDIIELNMAKATVSGVYLIRVTYTDSGKTTTFKVTRS